MKERILNVLSKALQVEGIDETCSQATCAAWDSMRHLNVAIELEMEFGVEFTPEEISEMVSYSEIIRVITSKLM